MVIDHGAHVFLVEIGAVQLRQLVHQVLVFVVDRRIDRNRIACRNLLELDRPPLCGRRSSFAQTVSHLRSRRDLGDFRQFDFSHSVRELIADEVLVAVADAGAGRTCRSGFAIGRCDCCCMPPSARLRIPVREDP
jgi:hypothetical protein